MLADSLGVICGFDVDRVIRKGIAVWRGLDRVGDPCRIRCDRAVVGETIIRRRRILRAMHYVPDVTAPAVRTDSVSTQVRSDTAGWAGARPRLRRRPGRPSRAAKSSAGDTSPERRRRWRRCRSGALAAPSGPARPILAVSGVVARHERVEEFGHRRPFGAVEEGGGLEGESERLVVGEPGVVSEDEGVGGARQGDGQPAQRREGRLGTPGFVLAQLGHVDAGALRQGDLGEAPGSAQVGEGLGEGHGAKRYRRSRLDGCCYAR